MKHRHGSWQLIHSGIRVQVVALGVALVLFCGCEEVPAPRPSLSFQRVFGTTGPDAGQVAVRLPDATYLVAGSIATLDATTTDGLACKLDTLGVPMWVYSYGGPLNERFVGVVPQADGSAWLLGTTVAAGSVNRDVLGVRINSLGQVLASFSAGGAGADDLAGVLPLPDGGAIAVGTTQSLVGGTKYGLVLRLSASGTLLWSQAVGGTGATSLRSAWLAPDNTTLWVSGYTGQQDPQNIDILVATFSLETGQPGWAKTYGTAGFDQGSALTAAETGTGATLLATIQNLETGGNTDILVAQLTETGESQASLLIGGSGSETGFGLLTDPALGVVVSGFTASFAATGGDLYLLNIRNGQLRTSKSFGGVKTEIGNAVIAAHTEGVLVVGSTRSYSFGDNDIFILKTDRNLETGNCGQFSPGTAARSFGLPFVSLNLPIQALGWAAQPVSIQRQQVSLQSEMPCTTVVQP